METISLSCGDSLQITTEGYYRVNNQSTYNPKYFRLKLPTSLNIKKLKHQTTNKPTSKQQLDNELKQLENLRFLASKIKRYQNLNDKLRTEKDENKFILGGRKLSNYKKAIDNYLETLKGDGSFTIEKLGDNIIKAIYKGDYVTATKTIQGVF